MCIRHLANHARTVQRQCDGRQSILPHFSLVKTPKCCSEEDTASPRSCPRTTSKPQPIHHICQSRLFVLRKITSLESSCNLYPQIAEYMLRAFGKSLCYNYRHFNTHSTSYHVHNPQTNAIFMYRLQWVFVPWSSPYKTNLAGKKSDFMKWNLLPMPTAIFMNRLLMVILRIYWLYLLLLYNTSIPSHTQRNGAICLRPLSCVSSYYKIVYVQIVCQEPS